MAQELHGDAPCLDNPASIADYLREEVRGYEVEHFQSRPFEHPPQTHPRGDDFAGIGRYDFGASARSFQTAPSPPTPPRWCWPITIPAATPRPREADVRVTRDLIRAGQLLKIEVLDHVILGRRSTANGKDYVSLRELGYFA